MIFPEPHEPDLSYDDRREILAVDYARAAANWNGRHEIVGGGTLGLLFVLPFFEVRARGAGALAPGKKAPAFDTLDETARDALQRVWRKAWLLNMPENADTCDIMPFIIVDAEIVCWEWLEDDTCISELKRARPLSVALKEGVARQRLMRVPPSGRFTGPDAAIFAFLEYCWPLFRRHRGLPDLPETLWR